MGSSCTVNSYITAADNYDITAKLSRLIFCCLVKEVNGYFNTVCIFTRNTRQATALTAYCDIEGFVALFSKLIYSNIFTDLDAALYLDSELSYYIDFSIDNILFKLIRRDTVAHHTARLLAFLEDSRLISLCCKIICARKTRWT